MSNKEVEQRDIDAIFSRIKKDAEEAGYFLNPDVAFTMSLVKGLVINERRYGYPSCPCRLATGKRVDDIDIICPCDYRDPDINEFGACYCALYVSRAIAKGGAKPESIPERRPPLEQRGAVQKRSTRAPDIGVLPYPVWRCRVCGYLCARPEPPDICPICKVQKERFERFM